MNCHERDTFMQPEARPSNSRASTADPTCVSLSCMVLLPTRVTRLAPQHRRSVLSVFELPVSGALNTRALKGTKHSGTKGH